MNRFIEYGFDYDEYLTKIYDILNNKNIKELHMDVYHEEPYMLFARVVDRNVSSVIEDGMMCMRKKDMCVFLNIVLNDIDMCMVKRYSDSHHQVIFSIYGVMYKMLIIT